MLNQSNKNMFMKPSKQTLSIARILHVYVSMALLTLLFFFSVTGITLNHTEWFDDNEAHIAVKELQLNIHEPMQNSDTLDEQQLAAVKQLVEHALGQSLENANHEFMAGELFYSLKKAGADTSISIDLATGELFYEHTDYGWWAYLNDLHKGRNTSNFWGWIIDLSSVFFIIFAITGFILAMPQRRFRKTLLLSVASTLAIIAVCATLA